MLLACCEAVATCHHRCWMVPPRTTRMWTNLMTQRWNGQLNHCSPAAYCKYAASFSSASFLDSFHFLCSLCTVLCQQLPSSSPDDSSKDNANMDKFIQLGDETKTMTMMQISHFVNDDDSVAFPGCLLACFSFLVFGSQFRFSSSTLMGTMFCMIIILFIFGWWCRGCCCCCHCSDDWQLKWWLLKWLTI